MLNWLEISYALPLMRVGKSVVREVKKALLDYYFSLSLNTDGGFGGKDGEGKDGKISGDM